MKKRILEKIKTSYLKFRSYSFWKKAAIVLFVIFLGGYAFFRIQSMFKDIGYITEAAKKQTITEIVTETGNIEAVGKTDVFSPATGIVETVNVANGDYVAKGQELFKVKSTATIQEQQAAYSNYLTAKNTLNTSQSTAYSLRSDMYTKWKDFRDLATNSNYEDDNGNPKDDERLAAEFQTSQDDWLAAEKEYKDQQTAIAQAQANVNSTWLLYQATENATVLAVSDGTISNLSVDKGDSIIASSAKNSITGLPSTSQPVLFIVNSPKYTARIFLNEVDVFKVKPGQETDIEVDAFRNKKFKGIVTRVDDIGTVTNGVIKYNAYIEILDAGDSLRYGMTVDADIKTKTVKNALTVSNSAVKPYKGAKAVRFYNKQTKKIDYIPVETGIKGQSRTEILGGISEGQEVITSLTNEQVKRQSPFGF